ncbi:MAG TPA: hypothetical protein VK509_13005, partial [Polyangiales bacterium]|nr:hypothetical protein [Polyangiales bacterium]
MELTVGPRVPLVLGPLVSGCDPFRGHLDLLRAVGRAPDQPQVERASATRGGDRQHVVFVRLHPSLAHGLSALRDLLHDPPQRVRGLHQHHLGRPRAIGRPHGKGGYGQIEIGCCLHICEGRPELHQLGHVVELREAAVHAQAAAVRSDLEARHRLAKRGRPLIERRDPGVGQDVG